MTVLCFEGPTSRIIPDLRVSTVQCELFSPAERRFNPESCKLLLLRSSSLRLEDWALRTEDRASQPFQDILQPLSLEEIIDEKKLVFFAVSLINQIKSNIYILSSLYTY